MKPFFGITAMVLRSLDGYIIPMDNFTIQENMKL